MTPEAESRVAQLRYKAAQGEDLTLEEMREVVTLLRAGRISSHHASDTARKRAAKVAVPSADDLLKELGGLE